MQSLLTFLIISSFIIVTACGITNSEEEEISTPVEFNTLLNSFETSAHMHEFETIVLTNKNDVDLFLTDFPTDSTFSDKLYNIDYPDSLVVGVFVGTRPNQSYFVNVDSVMVNSEQSLVYVTETGSSEGFDMVSWPAHFIVLSNLDFNFSNVGFPYKRICLIDPCEWPVIVIPD